MCFLLGLTLFSFSLSASAAQGRPLTLRRYICGVLTNPNCECEVNFIPMHTLSTWCSTPVPPAEPYPEVQSSGSSSDLSGSCSSSTSVLSEIRTSDDEFYLAHEALQLALTEWSDEVIQLRSEKIEGKGSNVDSAAVLADAHQAVDNVDDVFGFAPLPYSPPITPEQISLLVDVFHLPHSHGLVSTHLLKQLSWLWKSAGWCCVYPTAVLPNSLSTDQVAGTCEDDAMMTGGASSQSLMSQNSSIPVVPLSSCPLESHPSGDLAAGGSDADMQVGFRRHVYLFASHTTGLLFWLILLLGLALLVLALVVTSSIISVQLSLII